MGLAKVVRAVKDQQLLKNLIGKALERKEPKLPIHPGSYLRASSLASICAREEVLCALFKIVRVDDVSGDLGLIFAHGTGLHHVLQNEILPKADVLVGQWRCTYCGTQYGTWDSATQDPLKGLVPRPKRCEKCQSPEDSPRDASRFIYHEVAFRDEDTRITGHTDGFLKQPGLPGLGILEGKSISDKGAWEVRNVPKIEHVMQSQVYMMLSGLKWARILYWNKGGAGLSALIEHHVERDEETITEIRVMAMSIWKGLRDGTYPKRICETKDAPRAKVCGAAKECFADVEPKVQI